MRILVTGGLGFIGSALVRALASDRRHNVLNLDKVSYASTFSSTQSVEENSNYSFVKCDLLDAAGLNGVFEDFRPEAVMHLAAESHVDRSIDGPENFLQANVVGTFNLLEAARKHQVERFVHVSTDEVFGSLELTDAPFDEATPYSPRSPYSATKAASDHLARAWAETYEVPVLVTNCSNNYGPFQFPEKLIPLMTIKALAGEPLPVYGNGENVRDWLYVDDHVKALVSVLESGTLGDTYLIGGHNERKNIEIVRSLCAVLESARSQGLELPYGHPCEDLITYVDDRPGHDQRYAIDPTKLSCELGWKPEYDFESGLEKTVRWYIANQSWWQPILEAQQATTRIGTLVNNG